MCRRIAVAASGKGDGGREEGFMSSDEAREWQGGPQFGGEDSHGTEGSQQAPTRGPAYPAYGSEQGSGSRGIRYYATGCLVALAVFLLVGGIGCSLAWGPFVRYGISSDLVDYREAVRGSNLEDETRERLIFKIEHLRDALPTKSMGFFEWLSHSEALDGLTSDGQLTGEEVHLMERELDRIAKSIGTTFPGVVEESDPMSGGNNGVRPHYPTNSAQP